MDNLLAPRLFTCLLLVIYALPLAFAAAASGCYFVNPPGSDLPGAYTDTDMVFRIGESLNLKWVAGDEANLELDLYQDISNSTRFSELALNPSSSTYNWTVSLSYPDADFSVVQTPDGPAGNLFFFALFNDSNTNPNATPLCMSHVFNITSRASNFSSPASGGPSISSAATSTSGSPTSTAFSSSSSSISTSASSLPSTSAAPPSGLTTGQQAGIGIGVSLAGLLILAAIVWFVLKSRHNYPDKGMRISESPPAQPVWRDPGPTELEVRPIELGSGRSYAELRTSPSTRVRAERLGKQELVGCEVASEM